MCERIELIQQVMNVITNSIYVTYHNSLLLRQCQNKNGNFGASKHYKNLMIFHKISMSGISNMRPIASILDDRTDDLRRWWSGVDNNNNRRSYAT